MTMSANACGSERRPRVRTAIWNARWLGTGGWFRMPEATCTFCAFSACTTSVVVRLSAESRSGSSQTCMAYSREPNTVMEPTPSMRDSTSFTSILAKFEMNSGSREPSGE